MSETGCGTTRRLTAISRASGERGSSHPSAWMYLTGEVREICVGAEASATIFAKGAAGGGGAPYQGLRHVGEAAVVEKGDDCPQNVFGSERIVRLPCQCEPLAQCVQDAVCNPFTPCGMFLECRLERIPERIQVEGFQAICRRIQHEMAAQGGKPHFASSGFSGFSGTPGFSAGGWFICLISLTNAFVSWNLR